MSFTILVKMFTLIFAILIFGVINTLRTMQDRRFLSFRILIYTYIYVVQFFISEI